MTVSTAIAMARALWPAVTVEAAPDAFLTAWYPDALSRAGDSWFGDDRPTAVAHLLAHAAYAQGRVAGVTPVPGPTGALTSLTARGISASWGSVDASGLSPADRVLSTTAPGLAYLELRARQLGNAPAVLGWCE